MNILIIILLVIAGLVGLVFLVALFTRKEYTITRQITINKSNGEVFEFIKHLKNQDQFSKWVRMDPNLKKDFRGTDGTVGFVYAWEGNPKAGKGEQEIVAIKQGERLDVEIRFERPFAGIAHAPFIVEPVTQNQSKVIWGMTSQMKYPMNIMLLFMDIDKVLGKDLDESLTMLKGTLEH